MNTHPLVSIVTPCYNSARYLAETIESIRAQDYPHLEHLVIDGGSTDGTLEILQRYADRLTWISEPDKGQSDAINKGFRRARGEIVAWLNADDLYFPRTVRTAVEALAAHPDAVWVYGGTEIIDGDGATLDVREAAPFDVSRLLNEGDYISQPTVFMRSSVLNEVGLLDTDLHYCMDYDLWLRIGKKYPAYALPLPPLAKYRLHTASKTTYIPYAMVQERYRISQRHHGDAVAAGLYVLGAKWSIHASEEFAAGPQQFAQHYLAADYEQLPPEIQQRAATPLAKAYVEAGFYAYQAGALTTAADWFRAAVRQKPQWLLNRGLCLTLLRDLAGRRGIKLPHLKG